MLLPSAVSCQPFSPLFSKLQVVHCVGKAALVWGLNRFSVAFFLHPDTEDPYARLSVLGGPLLGDLIWPLYCRVSVGQSMLPGRGIPVAGT